MSPRERHAAVPMHRITAIGLLALSAVSAQAEPLLETRYAYDAEGHPTQRVDGLGQSESFVHDALGRLELRIDPLDGLTQYVRDGAGDLSSVVAPNGATTHLWIDGLGQVLQEDGPDRGQLLWQYNLSGQVVEQTDARGAWVETSDDVLGRPLTRRFYRADGTLEQTHLYTWDSAPYGVGHLAGVATDANRLDFAYDPQGHTVARTFTRGTTVLTTTWDYGPSTGRLEALTYPSGAVLTLAYDAAGRPSALTWDGEPIAWAIDYEPFGPVDGLTLGNGIRHTREHDSAGRISAYSLGGERIAVTYDGAGQITALTPQGHPQQAQALSYDANGRLTGYSAPGLTLSYSYDANGNRLGHSENGTATSYIYTPFSNRLEAIGTTALVHDATALIKIRRNGRTPRTNPCHIRRLPAHRPRPGWTPPVLGVLIKSDAAGNREQDATRRLRYDSTGRLVWACLDRVEIHYEYDAFGERVYKATGTEQRLFVYDHAGRLLGEYDEDGAAWTEYAWLGDLPVAVRQYRDPSGLPRTETFAIETDHLGTPRVLTDADQQVRWRWDSAPFGETLPDQSPGGLEAVTFNLRFPGQYFDGETGLHYNYFRDYDPGSGRYLESDPAGLSGGLNGYAYALSNPARYVDSKGLWVVAAGVAVLAAGVFVYMDVYPAYKADGESDLCACREAIQKANEYYKELRDMYPDTYKKNLSVGVLNLEGKAGATYISNGDKIFLGRQYFCSDAIIKMSDNDLFENVAHEALHANDPWYMRTYPLLGDEFKAGTHHYDIGERARSYARQKAY